MAKKKLDAHDKEPLPTKVIFTRGEWKMLLKLVDNKGIKVSHPDEFDEYKRLQEKLLGVLSETPMFDDEEEE